jgi:phage replication-related protein YjqB (UPF0714/DUF867 family)
MKESDERNTLRILREEARRLTKILEDAKSKSLRDPEGYHNDVIIADLQLILKQKEIDTLELAVLRQMVEDDKKAPLVQITLNRITKVANELKQIDKTLQSKHYRYNISQLTEDYFEENIAQFKRHFDTYIKEALGQEFLESGLTNAITELSNLTNSTLFHEFKTNDPTRADKMLNTLQDLKKMSLRKPSAIDNKLERIISESTITITLKGTASKPTLQTRDEMGGRQITSGAPLDAAHIEKIKHHRAKLNARTEQMFGKSSDNLANFDKLQDYQVEMTQAITEILAQIDSAEPNPQLFFLKDIALKLNQTNSGLLSKIVHERKILREDNPKLNNWQIDAILRKHLKQEFDHIRSEISELKASMKSIVQEKRSKP